MRFGFAPTWSGRKPPSSEFVSSLRGARRSVEELPPTVLVFEGLAGAGRRECAEVVRAEIGRGLLVVDGEGLMASEHGVAGGVQAVRTGAAFE